MSCARASSSAAWCSRSRSGSASGRTTRCCGSSTSRCSRRRANRSPKARAPSGRRRSRSGRSRRSRATRAARWTSSPRPAGTRAQLRPLSEALHRDIARLPKTAEGDKPVTLSVGEPFTTTLTVAFYFALLIALPLVLYELFGFLLPALNPTERRAVTPLLLSVPLLFAAGVAFGYFIVLPAAVRFFVNFNSGEFNNLVQANQFYKFAATILLAMGVVFQAPVMIIGATRTGIVTVAQLRRSRRYAIVACAAVAAFLPGDFITLLLETAPLYLLFEVSILLAAALDRATARRARAAGSGDERAPAGEPPPQTGSARGPEEPGEPTVQQIIDHTDDNLT
jgi:sec-independent protein translocase protein TatC